jgi:type I restriction enzyme S subunit
VDTGTTPSRKNADYWDNGSIPWVTSGELYDPFITDTKEKISEIALKETRLKIFPKGTLLIALYGQGITRGKSSELLIEATTNQACGTINVFEDFSPIKPYLKLYLQKNYDDIRKLSSGGVQPNLNSSKIKAMPIPLPPLAEQHEIVRRVSLLFERADAFDKEVVAASRRCERLTQAVLGNAFSGKL